jgi:hypothetical protein
MMNSGWGRSLVILPIGSEEGDDDGSLANTYMSNGHRMKSDGRLAKSTCAGQGAQEQKGHGR